MRKFKMSMAKMFGKDFVIQTLLSDSEGDPTDACIRRTASISQTQNFAAPYARMGASIRHAEGSKYLAF